MSESIQWERNGTRVYSQGTGHSYNCNNIATAKQLHQTLTTYENTLQTLKQTEEKLDKIQKSIIQIQLSLGILTDDIHQLKEVMTE